MLEGLCLQDVPYTAAFRDHVLGHIFVSLIKGL